MARVTSDQDDLDMMLPIMFGFSIQSFFIFLIACIMIISVLPLLIIVVFLSLIILCKTIGYYMLTAREIRRLYSISKSPVITSFKELISGSDIIRVMGK